MRRQNRILSALVILGALFLLGTSLPTAVTAAERVVIAQAAHALTFGPLYVAEKAGYFKDEGLDVELFVARGGAKARAAVVGGSAAVGSAPPIEIAQAYAAGQNLLFFALMNTECAMGLVVHKDFLKEKGITPQAPLADRVRALRGGRFSVTSSGSMTDQFLRFLLISEKMDPDRDVTITPMGGNPSAALAALERRTIDGITHAPPTFEMAEHRGYGQLLIAGLNRDVPELRGLAFTGLYTPRNFAEKNGQVVVKLVKAVRRALHLMHDDTPRARAIVRSYFEKIPGPAFNVAFDRMMKVWPKEPTVSREGVQVAVDFFNLVQDKPLKVRYEDFATNRYVEEAQR